MRCAWSECGKEFESRAEVHRYCSRRCQDKGYLARMRASRPPRAPLQERTCAYDKCRAMFQPKTTCQRFCTTRCGVRNYNSIPKAERAARRATKVDRHPNTELIHALRQEVGPGKCIYCEVPIRSKKAYICHERECRTEYQRDYGAIRRKRARETRAPTPERLCKCGCGTRFQPKYSGHLYADSTHTRRHHQRRWHEARTKVRQEARKAGTVARDIKFRGGKAILFGNGQGLPGHVYAAG